jgi:prevent-host-death family protein
MARTISATQFKAQRLALLDEVASTGQTLTITKHRRPVARVVPMEPTRSLRGSVRFLVSDEELAAPLAERWEAAGE